MEDRYSCPYLDTILLYVWFGSLYVFVFLTRWSLRGYIIYILLWVPSWTCVMLLPWFHPPNVYVATCTICLVGVSKATSCELWHDCYNLQGANFGASHKCIEIIPYLTLLQISLPFLTLKLNFFPFWHLNIFFFPKWHFSSFLAVAVLNRTMKRLLCPFSGTHLFLFFFPKVLL
jgi:hypothetical protein